eukprot:TRINITY_DN5299_c0_g1_i1.p1 TRINITY_DN5299_c0_g1~~TRINITY_DN5299_c0_g1_i1.p1  ORF type:complete len:164 (+),score=51.46 TRINITY_DN5299_c0_g1_i1:47-538(+)
MVNPRAMSSDPLGSVTKLKVGKTSVLFRNKLTLKENYAKMGLQLRQKGITVPKVYQKSKSPIRIDDMTNITNIEKDQIEEDVLQYEEIKKSVLKKPNISPNQRKMIDDIVKKYKSDTNDEIDWKSASRDLSLNPYQHTVSQLKKLIKKNEDWHLFFKLKEGNK